MSPGGKMVRDVALWLVILIAGGLVAAVPAFLLEHLWPGVGMWIWAAVIFIAIGVGIYWDTNADARGRGEKW